MGVDVCFGDSGGPLLAVENGYATLVGLVKRGDGCAHHPGNVGQCLSRLKLFFRHLHTNCSFL